MPSVIISPSKLKGKITPPPNPYFAWRALWGACLGAGGAISNCPDNENIRSIISLGKQLGADIEFENNVADIFGPEIPFVEPSYSCSNNSFASRLAVPLAFFFGQTAGIRNYSLPSPPLAWLDGASASLKMRILKSKDEISVTGPPMSEWLELSGREGAFWAPGFMMAIPFSENPFLLSIDDFVKSHASVKQTFEVLELFDMGYNLQKDEGTLAIAPSQDYLAKYIDVPSDWRTGSYYLGALALAGEGRIKLADFSAQAEKEFWGIFKANNVLFASEDGLTMRIKSSLPISLPPVIDMRPYPALIPLAMVLGTQCTRSTKLGPLAPMSKPMLNRARKMMEQLNKLGASISMEGDYISVPYCKLNGGIVDSCGDSRIAMALALAGLVSKSPITIQNSEAVDKVHAGFYSDLAKLGAEIKKGK